MIRMIFIMNWKAKNLLHTTFSRKMKEFRKQHVMESKFHSFWTKSKCRLKNFVAALNQFSQFVQCVQIVGARVFEVMFSVTTVCLVQGKCHFLFYFTGGVLWNHQVFVERLRCTKNVNQWAHNEWDVFLQQKLKWFRKQHAMESKFLSFWTKFKRRLKIFVAALTQFGLFVQLGQSRQGLDWIVGPGNSFVVFSTWNHETTLKTM